MAELHDRLDSLRSFVWWTAPLYALFLVAGLYAVGFVLSPALELLLGLLVAFGALDALALAQIGSIRAMPITSADELRQWQRRLDRLARILLVGGGALGAAFVVGVIIVALL